MKEIHVNAYTKKDGTHVKEHYRTIDSNNFTVAQSTDNQTSSSTPILTGGVSMDVDLNQTKNLHNSFNLDNIDPIIRQVIKAAANVALPAIPIASQIYQAAHLSDINTVNNLMPHLNNAVNFLTENQKVMKQNLENSLKKLTSTKNQDEYAALYRSFVNENEIYKKNAEVINKIKYATQNKDYEMVVKELDNYMNLQNNIIRNIVANPPINSQPIIERNSTAQEKPNINSMNFAPYPSPYLNSYTSPDYGINKNIEDYIKNSPQLMQKIIDDKLNFINKNTHYKFVPDGTEFWNAASHGLDNSNYIKDNGIILKNVYDIPSSLLKFEVISKLNTQGLNINNTRGVVFFQDSTISKAVANSKKFKDFIKVNKNTLITGNIIPKDSLSYKLNLNLFGALGKADVINTYIDQNDNLISIIIDTYEFNKNDKRKLIQMGRSVQDAGLLETFFVVIPIKIPKEIWSKWK